MKRWQAFLWIFLSLLFQVLTMILGKVAALRLRSFTLQEVAHNGPYLASLACLACQAVTWPQALRRFPLFWAYMFMSAIFLAIPVVSALFFHEPVTSRNLLGSAVIMAGMAVLLAGGEAGARG